MADVVKKVNQWVFPTSRSQNFTQADAGEGDVLMVRESLGRTARKAVIEAVAPMEVRFNVYHTVYPPRGNDPSFMHTAHLPNTASGLSVKDDTVALVQIAASETFELDGDFPISDIELVTVSGNFDILVT